jgi:hypothetical protein
MVWRTSAGEAAISVCVLIMVFVQAVPSRRI